MHSTLKRTRGGKDMTALINSKEMRRSIELCGTPFSLHYFKPIVKLFVDGKNDVPDWRTLL